MQKTRRSGALGAMVAVGLGACGNGGAQASRADATTPDAMVAVDVETPLMDAVGPVDLGTGADGFSTWQPGTALPPADHLVAGLHVDLALSYGTAAARVEEQSDGRAGGVSYYFNFADALGRLVYLSREGCVFDDVRVFKVVTAGESSGPVPVGADGVASVEITLSNPTDVRIAPLTEADLPPGATGACRALDDTSFEYEGLALVRHVTVGARVSRTVARCEVACAAQADPSAGCRSTCLAAPLPFTGQVTFDLDADLGLTATRPPGGALTYRREGNLLVGTVGVILR